MDRGSQSRSFHAKSRSETRVWRHANWGQLIFEAEKRVGRASDESVLAQRARTTGEVEVGERSGVAARPVLNLIATEAENGWTLAAGAVDVEGEGEVLEAVVAANVEGLTAVM